MLLRPHHLLCMQKFTGHGYSPAFTAHLRGLLQNLNQHPEAEITLICGCDDLCTACPHNQNGICVSAEKVSALDAGVLQAAALSERICGTWSALTETARSRILLTDAFHSICACCEWYPLCRQTEETYGTETVIPHG